MNSVLEWLAQFAIDAPRPYVVTLIVGLALLAAWAAWQVGSTLLRWQWRIAWGTTRRLVIVWPALASLGAMVLLLAIFRLLNNGRDYAGVVEALMPLALGIHAALLFAPDDEPPLDLLLTYPRPLAWLLLERVLYIVLPHLGVLLVGSVLVALLTESGLAMVAEMWVRCLPIALLLTGVGVCVTLNSRSSLFGAFIVILMWFAALGAVRTLAAVLPVLWPIHLYLPNAAPVEAFYWLNRALFALLGIALLALAATWLIRDPERLLLGGKRQSAE
jgi:hypothetical protein